MPIFTNQMKAELLNRTVFKGFSGASGIECLGERCYVIADNQPFLFITTKSGELEQKIQLFELEETTPLPIPKKRKPDLEAIALYNDEQIYIFGSGSKQKRRSNAYQVDLNDDYKVTRHDLSEMYDQLRDDFDIEEEDFNIEAACIQSDKLYLFNRGDNRMFYGDMHDFLKYLSKGKKMHFKSYQLELPIWNGIQAGVSGACSLPDSDHFILTASLENTSNWIDDGQVYGSYICYMKMDHESGPQVIDASLLDQDQEILPLKIESVAWSREVAQPDQQHEFLLVTDSDGGDSELLTLRFKLPKDEGASSKPKASNQ